MSRSVVCSALLCGSLNAAAVACRTRKDPRKAPAEEKVGFARPLVDSTWAVERARHAVIADGRRDGGSYPVYNFA